MSIGRKVNYGIQQVSMDLYCSMVRQAVLKDKLSLDKLLTKDYDYDTFYKAESKKNHKQNQKLLEAQQCIQRMEIASLRKYSFIKKARISNDYKKSLLFFTPSEELKGANVF